MGQLEVSSSSVDDYYSKWRISSGFFFDEKDEKLKQKREDVNWVQDVSDEELFDSDL